MTARNRPWGVAHLRFAADADEVLGGGMSPDEISWHGRSQPRKLVTVRSMRHWLVGLGIALVTTACGSTVVVEDKGHASDEPGSNVGDGGDADQHIVPLGTLAAGLASAGSDVWNPGRPAVASDGERFLVVTLRDAAASMDMLGIAISKDGSVTGTTLIATGLQGSVRIDVASDGTDYLLVYAAGNDLRGMRLSSDGAPLGAPIAIASDVQTACYAGNADLGSSWPAVAFGGGSFLVVYAKLVGQDSDLFAARISPAGEILGEFLVSGAPDGQACPAVAFHAANFMTVWQDQRNTTQWTTTDIYAARVTATGEVLDPEGIAVSTAEGDQASPHVAFDGTNFIATWYAGTDSSTIGDGDIRGARLGSDGSLVDTPSSAGGFAVNTSQGSKGVPRAVGFGAGSLVVWHRGGHANNAGIFGARLGVEAALLDPPADGIGLQLSPTPSYAERHVLPVIAAAADRHLLVWSDNLEVSGQEKGLQGALLFPW